ncbi:Hypothetical protein CINCED_3A011483 [Cinara cedri]|nr:Hypothetical protein CINCED_3A011483 [Cinara cedri]
MPYKEYKKQHKLSHYNLCWIDENEKPDYDDLNVLQSLLKKSLPKDAIIKRKVKFICEWCETIKKSVPGFASHIKQCQSRPDKPISLNANGLDSTMSDRELYERDISVVTCGRCNKQMTYKEYHLKHCSSHYNLCWIDGEDKLDLGNYDTVLNKLRQYMPFKVTRNRGVNLTCEDCQTVKKSIVGFASHVIFCNKSASDIEMLLVTCKECGNQIKPPSLAAHKLKNCKMLIKAQGDDINKNDEIIQLYRSRRKKRPPNVLSFHPDTKYVNEFYNFICRLCDFIASSVNDIFNHISCIHNIDINEIKYKHNFENCILNEYDVHKNIYLKPLLNYYNYSRKMFWKTICHENFHPDLFVLNNNEALKYLPSVQKSCKIFNLDDEQISVDLFKSAYVNGMYWLFTGGPNWAISWCPVPEDVKIQYLAIACHPKPDLVHKEMDSYKYPSILQLWTFNSLNNINYKPITASNMPYMSYGLAHEFGAVWDMAWCPSGAYEPQNKIGILALSTSCGDCPIFAMPCVEGNQEMYYLYKSKPVIARNFECEWVKGGVQCTKVCWQVASPFRTIICGYSNGVVSVFNLNFKSIFLKDDILYPSHSFRASRSSITGLSMNYFNSSILATTATDGSVLLWDLHMTENPIFQKKSYSPSDCTWLQQCYTLVYCSRGVNPAFLKVRTVNFSNYDNDGDNYIPELYVLNSVQNSKLISNYNIIVNNNEKLNCDDADNTFNGDEISMNNATTILNDSNITFDDADDTFNEEDKMNMNNETMLPNDSNINCDNESCKSIESSSNSNEKGDVKLDGEECTAKPEDVSKNIEEEDFYGPAFFQQCTHWTISGSNWMNVIATGNENGYIYETLFFPETNQMRTANSTTLQLVVRRLSSDTSQSEYSSGYRFKETVNEFGLESQFYSFHKKAKDDKKSSKPLLRYPLDNITKIAWNQNFSSFRWLASGTQCGFTIVSPSKAMSDSYFELFYETISNFKK